MLICPFEGADRVPQSMTTGEHVCVCMCAYVHMCKCTCVCVCVCVCVREMYIADHTDYKLMMCACTWSYCLAGL